MKAFRIMVLSFVLVFCLIISIGISKAEAFTYYGDFRWQLTLDQDPEEEPWIMRLGIADMGGGHLILSGRDEDCECVVHGSGEVIGSNIILILHMARNNEGESERALEISNYHVTLSLNSLDGTYRDIGTCCGEDPNQIPGTSYESGTFKFLGQAK